MVRASVKQFYGRMRHFVMHNILHADDPPHRLALGIAIGIFITFTPTIGLQTPLVVFLAWLLGGNKLVGVPLVWISNPVTIVPIYYPCYVLGLWVLRLPEKEMSWWAALRSPPAGRWEMMQFYYHRFMEILAPLTVGCLIVSTVLAVISYYGSLWTIRAYRMRRWGQLVPPQGHDIV